ncbi:MAG: hypothetical protein U9Q78_01165 [Chloroflexota bacterium]|nr:hypothetical protein [Chloroflexota bacterium]
MPVLARERSRTATVEDESVTWTERVLVVRSRAWAKRKIAQMEERLSAASAELKALTLGTGRSKRQIRESLNCRLTLIESQVRRGLAEGKATLGGLYEGQPTRSTDRPTGKRILKAFARAKITLLRVELNTGIECHMMPLSSLHKRILRYLKLPLSLYADLAHP